MSTRTLTAVALLILLPCCATPGPKDESRWTMPDHPLHRHAVWVEAADGGRGGGVIVHSSPEHGTYVLTAQHVVVSEGRSRAEDARVGVFRHSLRTPGPREPGLSRYPIDVVAMRFLIDETVDAAILELERALGALLRAAGDPDELPQLNRLHDDLRATRRDVERARTADQTGAALRRMLQAFARLDPETHGEDLVRASNLAAAAVGAERATGLANRVIAAQDAMPQVLDRWSRGGFVFHDAALVRLRTDRLFHAAPCADRPPAPDQAVEIATVFPEGEPLVRSLRMAGRSGRPDEVEVVGLLRGGNSGSPVFRANRLVGIAVRGQVDLDLDEETYQSGTFVSITAIRTWLARRGLDRLIPAVDIPAPVVLKHVVVMGASASAGYGTGREFGKHVPDVPLADLLNVMIKSKKAKVTDTSDALFFMAPESTGVDLVEKAKKSHPSCVIAIDYLFWLAYGNLKSLEQRQRRLATGLKLLEGLECTVLISELPDMHRATTLTLKKHLIPDRKMLDALNETIVAWARARKNVILVPLREKLADLYAGKAVHVAEISWKPPGALSEILQKDRLHPTVMGLAMMAALSLETLVEMDLVAQSELELDARAAAKAVRQTRKKADE